MRARAKTKAVIIGLLGLAALALGLGAWLFFRPEGRRTRTRARLIRAAKTGSSAKVRCMFRGKTKSYEVRGPAFEKLLTWFEGSRLERHPAYWEPFGSIEIPLPAGGQILATLFTNTDNAFHLAHFGNGEEWIERVYLRGPKSFGQLFAEMEAMVGQQ